MEGIVPPKGGGRCTWSEDVQPPQEKLCLAHTAHTDKDFRSKEIVKVISASFVLTSHLRSGESYLRHCKVVDERVEVV